MKILFINHYHLNCNSGIHIFNLDNQLTSFGIECAVCVPDQKDAVNELGKPLFQVVDFKEARQGKHLGKIDIIHAWTPRERVRLMTEELVEEFSCPYVVHLEDNEEALLGAALGKSVSSLMKLPQKQLYQFFCLVKETRENRFRFNHYSTAAFVRYPRYCNICLDVPTAPYSGI